MRHLILGGALLVGATASAAADWQYTRWGMTPDEVIAASSGSASRTKLNLCGPKAKDARMDGCNLVDAPYFASNVNFVASFFFEANKLTGVLLASKYGEDVSDVRPKLIRLYGAPKAEYGRPYGAMRAFEAVWDETSGGDQVIYRKIDYGVGVDNAFILYMPKSSKSGSGF